MRHIRYSKLSKIISSLFLILANLPLAAGDTLTPTIPCDFVGYEARALGLVVTDEVCATDTQENNLGKFIVDVDGQFGFLSIPFDNPQTSEKDGAQKGEIISFFINGVRQKASAVWKEAGLERVDLGIPETSLSVEITSPERESAIAVNPITIRGIVNDPQAQVEIVFNDVITFSPQVNSDGTFSESDVDLTGGPNIIKVSASDAARNTASSQISVYLGWVLHLKDVPWYEKEKTYYSGAATCKMILDYLRQEDQTTGLTQDELYNYGHPLNLSGNEAIIEMDAKAVDAVLGHFDKYDTPGNWYDLRYGDGDPYHGYNYSVNTHNPEVNPEAFNEYLRDIIHWIAYPVTIDSWWLDGDLAARPNSPAAVPIYGSYKHWIVVNGAVASDNPTPLPNTNPWFTPEVVVYGFWLSDPAEEGIGKDVYVTAVEAGNTYFLPLQTGDEYQGKYLQVAEPPEELSQAKVQVAAEDFNNSSLNLIKIARDLEGLSISYLFKDAFSSGTDTESISWQEIIQPQALTDADFRQAIEGSVAREFIQVEREDSGNLYYIIPFDKYIKGQFLTFAAIIVDAQTGAFKQASWVEEPVRFVAIKKAQAEKLAFSSLRGSGATKTVSESFEITSPKSQLIWQPQGLSNSPFFPYWKVTINNQIIYVTQNGTCSCPEHE